MENKKIIIDLQEGLFFEDTKNIIRWNTPLNDLKLIDNPKILNPNLLLEWENKKCLIGKTLNVFVERSEYKNINGYLEFIDFGEYNSSPWDTYNKYSKFFQDVLGTPSFSKKDNYEYPTSLWNIGKLQIIIGVAERFEEYSIFSMHYGDMYWELE